MLAENHDRWRDRLSEYLDGGLPAGEADLVQEHLHGCSECRTLLSELEAVVVRARGLEDHPPSRDLWPEVQAALEAPQSVALESTPTLVVETSPRIAPLRRRFTLSLGQLSAAAVLVALFAAGATWSLRPIAGGGDLPQGPSASTSAAGFASSQDGGLDTSPAGADVTLLQEALARGRDELSPNTVRIIERNLELIDRAIRESAEALAADPDNAYLEQYLRQAQERRTSYLREAAALLAAAG